MPLKRDTSPVFHCTDAITGVGSTAVLEQRSLVHHIVPVPEMTHLEATVTYYVGRHNGENHHVILLSLSTSDLI
jgi:hypothetical protein